MTVTELSKLTGYSISTVSKALSDSDEISAPAKEAILAAAKKTGYYTAALRRKKRIGVPKTVGVITDGFTAGRTLDALSHQLENAGITAVFCSAENAASLLADCLSVDALVLACKRAVHDCSVPVFTLDENTDEIVTALSQKQEPVKNVVKQEKKKEPEPQRKKEDIWLF